MNILDNDNDFNFEENLNAEYVMGESMNALWDMVIDPMESQLTNEEKAVISLIGVTLKLVAHKARLYEELQEGNSPTDELPPFSRN